MTLTQIKYFLTTAKTLSYTNAAKQLFVSQQVVSKQIRLLEEDLGLTLFKKNGKSIYLTQAGTLLHDLWSRHAAETMSALSEATLVQNNKKTVQIGVLDLRYVIDLVMPQIQLLEEQFPNIEFKYFLGDFATIEYAMSNGDIDLAVTLSTELPDSIPQENTLLIQYLQLGVFMNKKHPLAKKESVTIKDLSDQTFYLFDESMSRDSKKIVLIDCRMNGFEPQKVEYFNTLHNLEFAVLSGDGVTIGFDIFFQDPAGRLKMYPLETAPGLKKADLVVAWVNQNMKNIAEAFIPKA